MTHLENCFFTLEMLTLPSLYILSLLLFVIKSRNQSVTSSEIYHVDTRQHANFHQPSPNLAKYQKGMSRLGVKVFDMLPFCIELRA